MSQLAALKLATSRNDVARILQTSPQGFAAILYAPPAASRYTVFEIPKKGGGSRTIKAPDEKLKLLQKKLSIVLQDCLHEINKAKNIKGTVAHGFKRKCSIVTNAAQHHHRRWVFNLDLKDFFPSINFGRVRGFFIKDKNFLLHQDVATILAQIACDGVALPQGSPCSPVISNLIAHVLDMHIVRAAAAAGCTYSRYADDLTFSTSKLEFPADIAHPAGAVSYAWVPGAKLAEIISHCGFTVNERKTRMQHRDSRQDVTGLVVNRKVNVRCEYRHTVRAMVHRLFKTGTFQIDGPVTQNGVTTFGMRDGSLDELHGRLGFVDSIDLYNKQKVPQGKAPKGKVSLSLSNKELMYRQFLIYRDFYTAKMPVILCEGKTDTVFLKFAIRSLMADFPELANPDAEGKVRLKVRLYKYTKSSTVRILGLDAGGTGHIPKFIGNYKEETDKFSAPGLDNPFIILFDNDSGGDCIWDAIKKATQGKKAVNRSDSFTHVFKNLYAVPTPLIAGKNSSKIEDFFDAATLGMKLGNKTFADNDNFDLTQHFGKHIFAEGIVATHAKTINFSGFKPLLTSICTVVVEHAQKVADATTLGTC
jgi:RNA-directed DNA polymerase